MEMQLISTSVSAKGQGLHVALVGVTLVEDIKSSFSSNYKANESYISYEAYV